LLSYLLCFGALGGLVRHFHKNSGTIILPKLNLKNNEDKNISLGFLYDTLLGCSSVLCVPLFYHTFPTEYEKTISLGFVAGFVGQVVLDTISEKFINGLKISRANDAIKKNAEVSKKLMLMLENIKNLLNIKENDATDAKTNQSLKTLDNQLHELKTLLATQEEQCKKLN